jgi:hypothetical protein
MVWWGRHRDAKLLPPSLSAQEDLEQDAEEDHDLTSSHELVTLGPAVPPLTLDPLRPRVKGNAPLQRFDSAPLPPLGVLALECRPDD